MKARMMVLLMISSLPMISMQEAAMASETRVEFHVPVQNSGARGGIGAVSCKISREGRLIGTSSRYDLGDAIRFGGTNVPVRAHSGQRFRKGDTWECRVNFDGPYDRLPRNLDSERSTLVVRGTL